MLCCCKGFGDCKPGFITSLLSYYQCNVCITIIQEALCLSSTWHCTKEVEKKFKKLYEVNFMNFLPLSAPLLWMLRLVWSVASVWLWGRWSAQGSSFLLSLFCCTRELWDPVCSSGLPVACWPSWVRTMSALNPHTTSVKTKKQENTREMDLDKWMVT